MRVIHSITYETEEEDRRRLDTEEKRNASGRLMQSHRHKAPENHTEGGWDHGSAEPG